MTQILPIVIATVLANFIIAFLVFRKNPKSSTHRLLAYLAITTIAWTIFNYLALLIGPAETRLFWVKAVMFATTPYGTVILLLSMTFPEAQLKISKKVKWGLVIFNMFVGGLALSPYMFTHLENLPDGSFNLYPGWGIAFYAIGFMGFMGLGFFKLFKKYRQSKGILKQQLLYFLWGIILSFTLLTLTNFVAVTIFNTVQLTALGPPFTLIMFAFTGYAIVKHRFLDISYLAARALSHTLILATFVGIYTTILFALSRALPSSTNQTILSIVLTVVAIYSFNPLRIFLDKITDQIFFKGQYDTERLIAKLTKIMAAEIVIKNLGNKLLTTLAEEMKVTKGAFILINENEIQDIEQLHFEESTLKNKELISLLKSEQESYVFEELTKESTKDLFRKLNISIALPLKVKTKTIGLLVLGPKASGDIYSHQDLELLEIFAPQAAITLQNAESYRKIQSFSHTLEKKVQERTKELKEVQARELSKAKQLLKIKDEFVFIATHDLGTPVAAIKGFTHLLEKDKSKLSKDLRENIEALKEASNRLSNLTNDLLQIARSESGVIEIETESIDIIDLIKNTVKQVGPQAKEYKVTFHNKFHSKKCLVLADEEKLAEVIENLLSNAIKYNKEKGQVTVTTKLVKNNLQVDITDTGIGISKENHPKIFQKFARIQQDKTQKISGTGLGLFVVRMMIEKMKGKISFTSEKGQGTTFSFTLPLANSQTNSQVLKKPSK